MNEELQNWLHRANFKADGYDPLINTNNAYLETKIYFKMRLWRLLFLFKVKFHLFI
jgi:hypothetical protein